MYPLTVYQGGFYETVFHSDFMLCDTLLSLTACGGKTDSADTNRLVIWHDKEDAVITALSDYLAQAVPNLDVQFEKKTSLTDSLKLVGNDPSAAPDLFLFAHDKIGVFAEMGILAPVEPLLEEGALDNFLPMTLQAATYKDTLYQLPLYFETLLFMYNRRYMQDGEVPATTEELYAYMEEQYRPGTLRLRGAAQHCLLFRRVDPRFRRLHHLTAAAPHSPTRRPCRTRWPTT